MTDNFLKYELEAEAKVASKRRLITLLISAIIILTGGASVFAWSRSQPNDQKKTEAVIGINNSPEGAKNQHGSEPEKQTDKTTSSASNTSRSSQTQTTTPQTYTPIPQSIDKAAFISDGKKVMSNYNQVVGLVTFGPSMSDNEKANRIKQAVTLDGQYFSQVTNLRSNLVWANVSSGPYMEATQLAESGVSKISVGLTFMNYWVDNRSRTSDLQSGLGGVTEGSNTLLKFSQKLNAL